MFRASGARPRLGLVHPGSARWRGRCSAFGIRAFAITHRRAAHLPDRRHRRRIPVRSRGREHLLLDPDSRDAPLQRPAPDLRQRRPGDQRALGPGQPRGAPKAYLRLLRYTLLVALLLGIGIVGLNGTLVAAWLGPASTPARLMSLALGIFTVLINASHVGSPSSSRAARSGRWVGSSSPRAWRTWRCPSCSAARSGCRRHVGDGPDEPPQLRLHLLEGPAGAGDPLRARRGGGEGARRPDRRRGCAWASCTRLARITGWGWLILASSCLVAVYGLLAWWIGDHRGGAGVGGAQGDEARERKWRRVMSGGQERRDRRPASRCSSRPSAGSRLLVDSNRGRSLAQSPPPDELIVIDQTPEHEPAVAGVPRPGRRRGEASAGS